MVTCCVDKCERGLSVAITNDVLIVLMVCVTVIMLLNSYVFIIIVRSHSCGDP